MPKDTALKKILIIGAGPIVIGQACEFDYSGTQSCKALKEEGYEVVLLNSNPATIMTDPELSDAVYIEPINYQTIDAILTKEKPQAILPTVGGQTALNCALDLIKHGILEKHNVKLIGANERAIMSAENRSTFNEIVTKLGLAVPKNIIINSFNEINQALNYIKLPAIIRPSFTLGGAGGGIAFTKEQFVKIATEGLTLSPTKQVQVDESIIGWKEYELELIKDVSNNCIVICGIENVDPMGVHTGDSITVAPILTLRDEEYQLMRKAAISIMHAIGMESGGANVQFAFNPANGEMRVIEMNPRVSRSSALASKATGFPIAKVTSKLAVGLTLDEITNDSVKTIPAAFEPALDYIIVKIPRFNFDKFSTVSKELSSSMKSVGEVMAIGRCFSEALQKALCSLEVGLNGLNEVLEAHLTLPEIYKKLSLFSPDRLLIIADAIRAGISLTEINRITSYDMWFLKNIAHIIEAEKKLIKYGVPLDKIQLLQLKKMGFSDERIAELTHTSPREITKIRRSFEIHPVYKNIDTCAAEFEATTTYLYGCYEGDGINPTECESIISNRKKVIVLGSGPNRIGQGIEFDYACVHAVKAIQEKGLEAIMINCNPETVSTDYDISDKLYFAPLDAENVIEILLKEQTNGELLGVILQFGGQTPLKLAHTLVKEGFKILGTDYTAINIAEDRDQFNKLLTTLQLKQPQNAICSALDEVSYHVHQIGLPVIIRPSYVLGGQYMEIIYSYPQLDNYLKRNKNLLLYGKLLIDKFIEDALEVDVDAISDGENVYIAGVMEHIEEAGIHSGDSTSAFPPQKIPSHIIKEIEKQATLLGLSLKIRGLMNVQFAIKDEEIYVLELNPRASRTVPFIAKTIGTPIANIATKILLGDNLNDFQLNRYKDLRYVAVKQPVFSFRRFPGVDILLGPEMKSTGEVMGIDPDFEIAFAKAYIGSGNNLPLEGTIFISVKESDKPKVLSIAADLTDIGFKILATKGTANYLIKNNILAQTVSKVKEGEPHIVNMLTEGSINLIINTTEGEQSIADSLSIRSTALAYQIPCCTNIHSALSLVAAIKKVKSSVLQVWSLQELYQLKIAPPSHP